LEILIISCPMGEVQLNVFFVMPRGHSWLINCFKTTFAEGETLEQFLLRLHAPRSAPGLSHHLEILQVYREDPNSNLSDAEPVTAGTYRILLTPCQRGLSQSPGLLRTLHFKAFVRALARPTISETEETQNKRNQRFRRDLQSL
jgi:hypothetical protein